MARELRGVERHHSTPLALWRQPKSPTRQERKTSQIFKTFLYPSDDRAIPALVNGGVTPSAMT